MTLHVSRGTQQTETEELLLSQQTRTTTRWRCIRVNAFVRRDVSTTLAVVVVVVVVCLLAAAAEFGKTRARARVYLDYCETRWVCNKCFPLEKKIIIIKKKSSSRNVVVYTHNIRIRTPLKKKKKMYGSREIHTIGCGKSSFRFVLFYLANVRFFFFFIITRLYTHTHNTYISSNSSRSIVVKAATNSCVLTYNSGECNARRRSRYKYYY